MTTTPEPNFDERAREVGIDRAVWEIAEWQDDQRRAALDALVESNRAAGDV